MRPNLKSRPYISPATPVILSVALRLYAISSKMYLYIKDICYTIPDKTPNCPKKKTGCSVAVQTVLPTPLRIRGPGTRAAERNGEVTIRASLFHVHRTSAEGTSTNLSRDNLTMLYDTNNRHYMSMWGGWFSSLIFGEVPSFVFSIAKVDMLSMRDHGLKSTIIEK